MKFSEIDFESIDETKKIYDDSPYDTCFDAKVIHMEKMDDGKYAVFLDRTLFFPEEGGQTPDKGYLMPVCTENPTVENKNTQKTTGGNSESDNPADKIITSGYTVSDVRIKSIHGRHWIAHIISESIPVGTKVSGKIDWAHRYSNMQNHTGEHIFSGLVHSKYGYENVGFHLSDNIVTMDYSGPLTDSEVEELALLTNEVIWKNIPIITEYPAAERLKSMNYRSKIELEGPVRIVTIPDVDTCACCAPHVRSTGEVGQLIVLSRQNYKGGTRLSILCGKRAYLYNLENRDILFGISHALKIPAAEAGKGVENLMKNTENLKIKLKNLNSEIITLKSSLIASDSADALIFTDGADNLSMRNYVNEEKEKRSGFAAVFSGSDAEGYSFIIGSSKKNCQELLKKLQEKYNAKGGGKPEMIQGSLTAQKNELMDLFSGL